MIIDRIIAPYIIHTDAPLSDALQKISINRSGIVFCVDSNSKALEGALSDGDIRRWLLEETNFDLNLPVSEIFNRNYICANLTSDEGHIVSLFSDKIRLVPLVDKSNQVVAFATPEKKDLVIGDRVISELSTTFVIAEIGNNHNGSLALAKKMVDQASLAGADCVKFQMRDMRTLYGNHYDPNDESADLGAQYTMDLLARYQLTNRQLFDVFDYCKAVGVIPLCTPWDLVSLQQLEDYGMPAYKVASADLTNYELIDAIAATGKLMICSTGMSTEAEINGAIRRLRNNNAHFVMLHCNSTYPTPFKDVNLNYIKRLKNLAGGHVGYSGHERDVYVPVAAVALGACIIEKHFTLDRNMEGNDHKVSLLPNEFAQMVTGIRQIDMAKGSLGERSISQGEMMNREILAKSLVAKVDIQPGEIITSEMVVIQSPGQGLQPNNLDQLIGQRICRSIKAGEYFTPADIGVHQAEAKEYNFDQPWGVPVRFHDFAEISSKSNMDLVEIHLSYKDLEVDYATFLPPKSHLGLVVHAPELFKGDHVLDLCASDERYRQQSIRNLQRVIDLTRAMKPRFNTEKPMIVTNVGGFTADGHIGKLKRNEMYRRLENSLAMLEDDGVEIIIQTMPPYPWHFGGQQFHNLFVRPEEIVAFCKRTGIHVCLDVSHSKLASSFMDIEFKRFLEAVLPYSKHMHIADAKGLDGEGLQVGNGSINWQEFAQLVSKYSPTTCFIPEIWQGHKNANAGAWEALAKLEKIFTKVA